MTDWRERFDKVARETRENHERAAPIRGRQAAVDDLYRRIGADMVTAKLLMEVDDLEVLQSLVHRALTEVAFYRYEYEQQMLAHDDGAWLLCLDCGANTAAIGEYYMVKDSVWTQAAEMDAGMLCIGCLEERLGRQLEPDDFLDIPLNHEPSCSARLRARVLGIEEAPAA